jgi:hypothetical protein
MGSFGGILPGMNSNGGPPNPAQLAAFFGAGGTLPGWGGAGEDERHGSGPRRTGNRYNNTRVPGPYDRQSKDGRNARWPSSGRLTPPRGGRPPIGNPRFSEGGTATLGPREAVQGRALKSYEDLDAAGAGEGAALDY